MTVALIFVVVCSIFCFEQVSARRFVTGCSLKSSPRQPLTFDAESNEFVLVRADDKQEGGDRRTLLEDESVSFSLRRGVDSFSDALQVSSKPRSLQTPDETEDETDVLYTRECQCASRLRPGDTVFFCSERFDSCGIPASDTLPIGCFKSSSKTEIIRNAWPVVVLWYAALGIFLLFTEQGRQTRYFLVSKCYNRDFNRSLLHRYWYQEGGYWRLRQQRGWFVWRIAQRRAREAPGSIQRMMLSGGPDMDHVPNQLTLKTKRFEAPSHHHVEEPDDEACAICFAPLEDGDRVGALPCNHTFHVTCLKTWLPRRNVCPLCQAPGVATPRYQPGYTRSAEDQEDTTEENEDSDQDSGGMPEATPHSTFSSEVTAAEQESSPTEGRSANPFVGAFEHPR